MALEDLQARAPRNPDWTEEETLLAMDAYFRLRPQVARQDLDVIMELSNLLQTYGRLRGLILGPTFRNPAGVARKVFKFSAAERGDAPDTIRGAELEKIVWDRYRGDPGAVAIDADALRLRIYIQASGVVAGEDEEPNEPPPPFAPSNGPAPSFGRRVVDVNDSDCVVYVNVLDGDVAALFPMVPSGEAVLKIGRSNNPSRRVRELNSGFPPAMGCAWTPIAAKPYTNAQSAHDTERALLLRLYREGRSLGGEFVRAPRSVVRSWFD